MTKKQTNKMMNFYMWRHPYTGMTCYGITGDKDNRQRTYQGGNGFDIQWSFLVEGEPAEIRKLERTLKKKIIQIEGNLGRKISYGAYEWVSAEVDYASIVELVESFIEDDNYKTLVIEHKEKS